MKSKTPRYRHGFLGAGKMAQVLLGSLLGSGLAKPREILVSRSSPKALAGLVRQLKVAGTLDNRELAERCDWIWLGIKPFQAADVLAEIAPRLSRSSTLLSMMAGISTKTIRRIVGRGPRIVRFMPNTPARIGQGMTGVYFAPPTPAPLRKATLKILRSLGHTLEVRKEDQLDAVTGLSGSGPAFVYYLAEALAEGGRLSGLKAGDARLLAYQTLLGAVGMLKASGKEPKELIAQVVSKGGTTEAGLQVLEASQTAAAVREAVRSASRRAREIKEQYECSR